MASELNSKDMESYVLPLRRILGELKPKTILDLGVGFDCYSAQIWLEDGNTQVTSVDKADWGGWGAKLMDHFPKRYKFIMGRTEDVLPTLEGPFDLIYIDADHAYDGSKVDMLNSMKLVTDGVILLDDYGVTRGDTAIDIVEEGKIISGFFGIKKAADEVFDDEWERCFTHIDFGNGGVAFRRKK